MSKKENLRRRIIPRVPGDVDSIILWSIRTRLRLVRQIARNSQRPSTGKSGKVEGLSDFLQFVGSNLKADEDTIMDYMRAEVWEWWRSFPDDDALTKLYQRTKERKKKSGSKDDQRFPTHSEGLRVARPMLADIPNTAPLDSEWESKSVSITLALLLMSPIGVCDMDTLQEYIECSEESRAYFDTLVRYCEGLESRGEKIPRPAAGFQQSVASGLRYRPAMKPRKSHRPTNPAFLLRNVQVQYVIRILSDVRVKPTGDISGCRIVADATGIPEDTVLKIWKGRNKPFSYQMNKYWKAIDERHGPFHPTKN